MAKLSPEKRALRADRFRATMKAKREAEANRPKSVAEREAQELYGLEPVTAAEVMAAKPTMNEIQTAIAKVKRMNERDPRLELTREIVRLLQRVLA